MTNKKSSTPSTSHLASNILRDHSSSEIAKSLAGSVLSQTDSSKQTGEKLEDLASKVLNSNKYSEDTKSLAGSVLSQSDKKR
jgi:hypothetical protein